MEDNRITFLDGSKKKQEEAVKVFLNSITPEEHERAMSSEFDYIDVDSN